MAYTPNNWVDREGTTRYFETIDSDGALIFTPDYTKVTEMGTPVNADNMNHIEEGIAAGSFTKYNDKTTYEKDDLVTAIVDNQPVIFKSLKDNHTGMPLDNVDYWEQISLGGSGGAYTGQIIPSLDPLFEDGLHLLDGGMVYGDGIYDEFVNTYIANLYAKNPERFLTEEQWQEHVNTYGVCGRYVYDTVANTVRLPKVTGIVEGTIDVSALGDLVEAGLPNITGKLRLGEAVGCSASSLGYEEGALAYGDTDIGNVIDKISGDGREIVLNASLSNPIYGNSDTVQPQTIKGYYYIVLATEAKTKLEVDLDNIAVDLNNKVDKQNMSAVSVCIEEYTNGTSGYRVYSDVGNGKYCEQWGIAQSTANNAGATTELLKLYRDINYILTIDVIDPSVSFANDTVRWAKQCNKTISSFKSQTGHGTDTGYDYVISWHTKGYLA